MALRPPRDTQAAGASVPKLPASLVRRPRLEQAFAEDQRCPVTLVSSVPGGGKTTLLASWARDASVPVAWRTVEERDNRRGALARAVVGSLADTGAVSQRLLGSGQHGPELLEAAFAQLETRARRTVLVLDDVDRVTTKASVGVLDALAWRAPPTLDVVLAGRADPPLRWGRLRLEGRLGELRDAALSFRPTEAAELFATAGLRIRRHDLAAIHARTEGWAAGLRLVASAIERGAAPERLASEPATAVAVVADYLVEEVLAREPAEVQQFLLRTSVAETLTVDLAFGLSEQPEAGAWLEDLQRRGLFVIELEGGEWYRYHSLFGALLRGRLRRQDPLLWRRLHAHAARWYAERELSDLAEEHARRAEEWELLGSLVRQRWLDATVDGVRATPSLLAGVTSQVAGDHPALAVVATAVALEAGDLAGAEARYPRLPTARDVDRPDVGRQVLELVRSRARGADDDARSTATALACGGGSPPADARLRRWALLRSAELDLDTGAVDRARTTLAALADDDRSPVGMEAAGLLALVQAVDAQLAPAGSLAEEVLGAPDPGSRPIAVASARLALVLCESQAGKPVATAAALAAVDASAMAPSRVLRVVLHAVRAAQGGAAPVVGLDTTAARHPFASSALVALGVLELVDAAGARRTLGGPAEAGLRELRHAAAADLPGPPAEMSRPIGSLPSGGHVRTRIELCALAALTASPPLARRYVQDALGLAEATQVRAPLVVHHHRLEPVLRLLAAEPGPHQRLAVELLDAGTRLNAPAFVEALTDQEQAVLGFLPTLMSNREIASAMHLSVNTVKTHVKAVYRKLGVERRRNAVVRARQLELL